MSILILSGRARSGKDTFGKILAKVLQDKTGEYYVLMAYATELKNRVQRDFDLSWDQLWGDDKEIPDSRYLRKVSDAPEEIYECWTARRILQNYGEFFRSVDNNFWVKALFNLIDEKEYKNVIITDGRYPNEIDSVLDRGGFHIRINRENKTSISNESHISETALDGGYKVDVEINNSGTIEDLEESAKSIAELLTKNNRGL